LAGTIGKGVDVNFAHGIDAFASILKRPCTLEEAIGDAAKLLVRAAEDALRMIGVGLALAHVAAGPRSQRRTKPVAAASGLSLAGLPQPAFSG
jgi:glycerate kinase